MDWAIAGVVFSMGFSNALHCIGMCGGVMCQLTRGRSALCLFHMGRVISYMILGGVAAFALAWLHDQPVLRSVWQLIWVCMNAFLLLAGLVLLLTASDLGVFLQRWVQRSSGGAGALSSVDHTEPVTIVRWLGQGVAAADVYPARYRWLSGWAGLLWGLVPCGWLWMVLGTALQAETPWKVAVSMAFFAIGSGMPLVFLRWATAQGVQSKWTETIPWLQVLLRRVSGAVLCWLAVQSLMVAFAGAMSHHHHG